MVNCAWNEAYSMGRSSYLRYEGSDHRPLITHFNDSKVRHKGLFCFNRSLTEKEEITAIVEEAWNHDPLGTVIVKLNAVRRELFSGPRNRTVRIIC